MIVLDVSNWIVWYYLLIAIILMISIWALLKHKEGLPFMWGITLSIVLFVWSPYIAPLPLGLFAYWNVDWWIFGLIAWILIWWLGTIVLCLYNMIKYKGKVFA